MTRNLSSAFGQLFRHLRRGNQPKLSAFVPEFPFRCQHCEKPIKLAKTSRHVASAFCDDEGIYFCETSTFLPHRPMPSVLG